MACVAAPSGLLLVALALAAAAARGQVPVYPQDPAGVPLEFICAWRGFAAEYSTALRPDAAREAFDALQLALATAAAAVSSPGTARVHRALVEALLPGTGVETNQGTPALRM